MLWISATSSLCLMECLYTAIMQGEHCALLHTAPLADAPFSC